MYERKAQEHRKLLQQFISAEPGFMELGQALEIVWDLANQNALETNERDAPELVELAKQQELALAVVHDFIVNHFEED
jgi:hypothetical protein